MTKLPKITKFTGLVPDKATMDKDTFANSVHNYLNYFNDTFVPESQDFTDKMNTLSDEVQTAADNAALSEQNAKTSELKAYDWAETDEDVEVESGKYSAKHWAFKSNGWANLSYAWAETDEDVEVESGKYSAKHWAKKAENAVAVLPEGTIDDGLIASDKAWSSQKISDELNNKLDMSAIDDNIVADNKLWSSQKIASETLITEAKKWTLI
jgi:hypothetical protein